MKAYEITYLIAPSLTAEEAEKYHEKIKGIISKANGVLGKEQSPSKRVLAYPIKKNAEGYLASADFESSEDSIKEISKKLKKEKDLLRYLLIKKEINKTSEKKERSAQKKGKSLKPEKAKLKEIDEKIDEIL